MRDDVSTALCTSSRLDLDVGVVVIGPHQTACIRLIKSIGQVFGLFICYSYDQDMQSEMLMCQIIKASLSLFFS